jgi:lipopolysaccharide transport system permease protein
MLTKIYFPRAIPAIVPSLAGMVDFVLAFLVLIGMAIVGGYIPGWQIIFVPIIIALVGLLASGVALLFAPINAIYRDVGIALPYFIQILMFASPVMYSVEIVPEPYRFIYDLNPVATFVGLMRWSIFGTDLPHLYALVTFVVLAFSVFGIGLKTMARLEQTLIDRL